VTDFLVTVTAYKESASGPIGYESLRERMASLGLRDYLINDAQEWIALPENVYAAWVEGEDSDSVVEQWRSRLASQFDRTYGPGVFFVTVGSDAVWFSQLFE
jgi:hypothetical protein